LDFLHVVTLQRSPYVLCSHVADQVTFDKNPASPNAGARNFSGSRLGLQCRRMNLEQRSGLLQSERRHGVDSAAICPMTSPKPCNRFGNPSLTTRANTPAASP